MSILVTGGAGYIGSHMVCALASSVIPRDQKLVSQIIREHKIDSIIHFGWLGHSAGID
jgi:UDP-glucose 4-epimerase